MSAPWARLRASLIPGNRETELWIHDGVFRMSGPAEAPLLASPGGFALSGLVDAHCHLSWPHEPATPSHTREHMNANRLVYAGLGTTLLRDLGSNRDEVIALADEPGLPPVRACGMMLLRDDKWPLTDTPPAGLREAALARVARGAKWVKIFADFSEDFQGRVSPGFTGDDEVTYPLETLKDAVGAVHAAGARVAAHGFSRAGADVAIAAGVDSLEHGWGVDEAMIDRMAAANVEWVPLLGIAPKMLEMAEASGEAQVAAWIRGRMEALRSLIPLAVSRRVSVFAGTDWFPNPTVVDELLELRSFGVPGKIALALGTYETRAWLGFPGIEDGARADLVLYREDPRLHLEALFDPEVIVIGGRRVTPSPQPRRLRMRWRDVATARRPAPH